MNRHLFLCALLCASFACSDDPASSNKNNTNTSGLDMGTSSMADDMKASTCVPITQCSAQMCGKIDDGCGGMLECNPCACKDGQPLMKQCGACGLGTVVCQQNDQGSCQMPELGGLELPQGCEGVLFVGNDPEQANAYPTLSEALQNTDENTVALLLASGDHDYNETLELASSSKGISLVGGFDPANDWAHSTDPSARSVVKVKDESDTTSGQRLIGLSVNKAQRPVVVAYVNIELEGLPFTFQEVRDMYGFYANGSKGLRLEEVDIVVPDAPSGMDGLDGIDGADGKDGKDAGPAYTYSNFPTFGRSEIGEGGKSTGCLSAGGDGGFGAHAIGSGAGPSLVEAQDGKDGSKGLARGGDGGNLLSKSGENGKSLTEQEPNGKDGKGATAANLIASGYWRLDGGNGEDGTKGKDGLGGGGGGGGSWNDAQGSGYNFKDRDSPGGSGGGGGAGGCGGTEGKGGRFGGSSFGLFLFQSPLVQLKNVKIAAGAGGDGGNGGQASLGGLGGKGGLGATALFFMLNASTSEVLDAKGGNGGKGSDGGSGGYGGGGAGGSSFGIYCSASSIVNEGTVNASSGKAGAGGKAGAAISVGAAGMAEDIQGCE